MANGQQATQISFEVLCFNKLAEQKTNVMDLRACKCKLKLSEDALKAGPGFRTTKNENVLDNVCLLTSYHGGKNQPSSLVAMSVNNELMVIDPKTGAILQKKSFVSESQSTDQLTTVNKLTSLKCFEVSCIIAAVKNTEELVLIEYFTVDNKLSVSTSSSTSAKYSSDILEINNHMQAGKDLGKLILAHEKTANQLILYDADIFKTSSAKSVKSKVAINDSELNAAGFSTDSSYIYTIEDSKVLKFYSVKKNMSLIAQFRLYSIPICCHCTSDYVSVSMQDRRIISLLIADPDVPGSVEKIGELESRKSLLSEEEASKVIKSAKNMIHSFDDPGDVTTEGLLFREDVFTRSDLEAAKQELNNVKNKMAHPSEAGVNPEYLEMLREEKVRKIERVHQLRSGESSLDMNFPVKSLVLSIICRRFRNHHGTRISLGDAEVLGKRFVTKLASGHAFQK